MRYVYGPPPFPGSDRAQDAEDEGMNMIKPVTIAAYGAAPTPESPRAPSPDPYPLMGTGTVAWPLQPVWAVAGHCPHCGAPIYSRKDPAQPLNVPEVHFNCECRNKVTKKRKPRKRVPRCKVKK